MTVSAMHLIPVSFSRLSFSRLSLPRSSLAPVTLFPIIRITTLALVLSGAASLVNAHTVVVVNTHNAVDKLTQTQVADIFLARSTTFPNGTDAVPIDQSDTSPTREAFYQAISGKSAAQLKAYWSTLIFTGRGEPPREVGGASAVKKVLSQTPTAVGYIDDAAVDASVKVVLVLP